MFDLKNQKKANILSQINTKNPQIKNTNIAGNAIITIQKITNQIAKPFINLIINNYSISSISAHKDFNLFKKSS